MKASLFGCYRISFIKTNSFVALLLLMVTRLKYCFRCQRVLEPKSAQMCSSVLKRAQAEPKVHRGCFLFWHLHQKYLQKHCNAQQWSSFWDFMSVLPHNDCLQWIKDIEYNNNMQAVLSRHATYVVTISIFDRKNPSLRCLCSLFCIKNCRGLLLPFMKCTEVIF